MKQFDGIIALDAMGGDFGPAITVPAAITAIKDFGIKVILVGNPDEINVELSKFPKEISEKMKVIPSEGIVEEGESPVSAYRNKPNASIFVSAGLVKKGYANGVVSMGSSGATLAAASILFGTMDGIERGSIGGPIIGYSPEMILLDLGSNVDTKAVQLVDFAAIGDQVSKLMFNKENPKIALLSVGSEEGKGNILVKESFELLSKSSLNFVGNIEPEDLFEQKVDVVICDGFVGNILLKTTESLGKKIATEILDKTGNKDISENIFNKTNVISQSFGGGPIFGINGIAIIGHGSSQVSTIVNAIKTAKLTIENNWVEKQQNAIKKIRLEIKD
ncbi:phosphate acyltransferase PlsX [Chloroflexi bacterium]|jgi:glycerol-3-phosphate acyltransferase PlsX|nr:phosphate acyltransferase PlsX [Chloroflexota bacterium]MDC0252904.1 phosphate acyltransferase PlsX [Chloroflexota bacterium]|tara:strand:- start:981 stop:1979 length:999 start_codon:yes stop_codon:yes gene_type:complete